MTLERVLGNETVGMISSVVNHFSDCYFKFLLLMSMFIIDCLKLASEIKICSMISVCS